MAKRSKAVLIDKSSQIYFGNQANNEKRGLFWMSLDSFSSRNTDL